MNFSQAFEELLNGKIISRKTWPSFMSVKVQFPDERSANTEPYLYMIKESVNGSKKKRFPLDMSCESMFADDWFIVE